MPDLRDLDTVPRFAEDVFSPNAVRALRLYTREEERFMKIADIYCAYDSISRTFASGQKIGRVGRSSLSQSQLHSKRGASLRYAVPRAVALGQQSTGLVLS